MPTTSPDIPLPLQEAVRDLFTDLLSRGCAVDKADEPLGYGPDIPAVLADYVDADGHVAGTALADVAMAARSGSALVMMPANVAEEAVAAGHVDGDMLDCYREVANVLSRLMNSATTPHVKLRRLYQTGDLLPGEVRAMLRGEGCRRRDYVVNVEEYGEGRLTVLARVESP